MGLYCETVVGTRNELLVPNALESPDWKINPDIKLNMISYYGLPIQWDDGEVFGTICILDKKKNSYSEKIRALMREFRDWIQNDLSRLTLIEELQQRLSEKDLRIREVHHRVKNHLNILISSIQLGKMQQNNETSYQAMIEDISGRLLAIQSMYQRLNASERTDDGNIALQDYLHTLASAILQDLSRNKIVLQCSGSPAKAAIEPAVTLGLLLSELMTNSLKHAFAGMEQGGFSPTITIDISEKDGAIFLSYSDNGRGDTEATQSDLEPSLGMTLIRALVTQLKGEYSRSNQQGLQYRFRFPVQGLTRE